MFQSFKIYKFMQGFQVKLQNKKLEIFNYVIPKLTLNYISSIKS